MRMLNFSFFVFDFSRKCPLSDFSTLTGETIFGRIILKKEWTSGLKRDLALDF